MYLEEDVCTSRHEYGVRIAGFWTEDGNSFGSFVFKYLELPTTDKVQKPNNSVIHHRRNPLDSTSVEPSVEVNTTNLSILRRFVVRIRIKTVT
jgi:hypothetical protein